MSEAPEYRRRVLDRELDELMGSLPAIAIEGAKAVGKTETALRRAKTVWALDQPTRLEALRADPSRFTDGEPPVLIDEWQHLPEIWDRVRRAVDGGLDPGRVLLTGSSSPARHGSHSGAGRIVSLRMRPMSLAERFPGTPTVSLGELLRGRKPDLRGTTDTGLGDYVDEILNSGFPGMRHLEGRALRTQLDGYLTRIVDRDFPELGHRVRNPTGLKRWMAAYAAATSTTASWEKIRDAAAAGSKEAPARTTTLPYRDILERLWILDPLPGWKPSRTPLGRLTLPPKHHLADPSLAVRLIGASRESLLSGDSPGPQIARDGTMLGSLFESLVTQSVRVYCQSAEARLGHLRTYSGEKEIDLILERADGRVIAVEVKLAPSVDDHDVRHLTWLRGRIGDDVLDGLVINTGPEAYRRSDGIGVVPAMLFGP